MEPKPPIVGERGDAVVEVSLSSFGEFKKEILGENPNFRVDSLFDAHRRGRITEEQFNSLILVYARQLEEEKIYLQDKVNIEVVSGLFNRVVLEEKLDGLIKELQHEEGLRKSNLSSILLVTIDLRGLNKFNAIGQDVGDLAIRTFADRLRHVAKRYSDMVFRNGARSDEFEVLFTLQGDLNDKELADFFERVRKDVDDDLYIDAEVEENGGGRVGRITKKLQIQNYMGYAVYKKGERKTREDFMKESARSMAKDKAAKKKN